MNQIQEVVFQKEWNVLISTYSVKDICLSLSFSEAMHIVKHLFYDDIQDDDKQQYALKLAFEIKDHFKNEWESDWKNDVFLGGLCVMLWRYVEKSKNLYVKFLLFYFYVLLLSGLKMFLITFSMNSCFMINFCL